jgi:DNA-binding transcriptional ArsR family regulator
MPDDEDATGEQVGVDTEKAGAAQDVGRKRDHALPKRRLCDPRELRALAHPVRMRLLDQLFLSGPLTASELADRVQESPANCSWHLRQLAKYGYVEEAGGGTGRQRPWRAVAESRSWVDSELDAEATAASDAVTEMTLQYELAQRERYKQRQHTEPADWDDAAFYSQSFMWLTLDELRDFNDRVVALLMEHVDRFTKPETRPADARAIRFVAWAFPAKPWSEDEQ